MWLNEQNKQQQPDRVSTSSLPGSEPRKFKLGDKYAACFEVGIVLRAA
jgi:hypothetical protein